jgi:DtxR family Mn-dependent transcriptional regulator
MPLDQIHEEAHHREHTLSVQQVDELEAALGHPSLDPHGDPIPGPGGKIKPSDAKPLTSLAADEIGRVVHLEDEPAIAYAQIQAEGIHLGQTCAWSNPLPDRLVVTDGSSEYTLAPVVAANVHFMPVERLAQQKGLLTLRHLAARQKAEIVELDQACQGFTRRRFLDLGLTPGTVIFPELPNPFGDPRAYRVRGTLIALRKDQADQIWMVAQQRQR